MVDRTKLILLILKDYHYSGEHILAKISWPKTLQFNNQIKLFHIPIMNNSLHLVTDIKNVLILSLKNAAFVLDQNNPWLGSTNTELDHSQPENIFFILNLNLPPSYITWRSRAIFLCNSNVPLQTAPGSVLQVLQLLTFSLLLS